jgi:molybdate transport system substrate-binding protein
VAQLVSSLREHVPAFGPRGVQRRLGRRRGFDVTVRAAASLTDAFGEFEGSFEEQNPGTAVQVSFAGTSELLTQIQQGASADVFASADKA